MPLIRDREYPRPPLLDDELGYAGYPAGIVLGEWPIDLGTLPLDRVDEYGGLWNVTAFTGKGTGPTEIAVTQRPTGHGAWIGERWYAAKQYTIDGAFEGESPADRFAAEQRLNAAVPLGGTDMILYEEVPRMTRVIPNGEVVIDPVNVYAFTFQLSLLAPDPFRYGIDPYEGWTHLPAQSGGMTWPAKWPAKWRGSVTSGLLQVVNEGNTTSYPIMRVYGPLSDFLLSNPRSGELLSVDLAADGESLAEGEWIEIDMKRQRVMLLGQSTRRRSVRGSFFGLEPGLTSVLFSSTDYNALAYAEIEGFSTWL